MKTLSEYVIMLLVLLFTGACSALPGTAKTIEASGNQITETLSVNEFDRLNLAGFGTVNITQGTKESLTVTTDENFMPYINASVEGNMLTLGFTDLEEGASIRTESGAGYDLATFNLVVKDLHQINLPDSGNAVVNGLDTDKLHIDLSGFGSLEIVSLSADELTLNQSGAGTVIISGQVGKQEINHSGFGNYHARGLKSDAAILEISSVGDATVWAEESLNVTISGFGNVIYSGNPSISQEISGHGKLVHGAN